MRAVRNATCKWVILYIERWLKAPIQLANGKPIARCAGVPQGGVVSPVLANLYMHYTFDLWMKRTFPELPWCRYADDALVHCRNEEEAMNVKEMLEKRLKECKLEFHPDKTKIVYCKDGARREKYSNTKFDFLGYTFRGRLVKNRVRNSMFINITPNVSLKSIKSMKQAIRRSNLRNRTDLEIEEISKIYNSVLRGWMNYYGALCPSAMTPLFKYFNMTLRSWAMRKYRSLKGHKTRASLFIVRIAEQRPNLFIHWGKGIY